MEKNCWKSWKIMRKEKNIGLKSWELRENLNLREYLINKLIIIIIKLLKKLIKKIAFKYTWMIVGKFSAWVKVYLNLV